MSIVPEIASFIGREELRGTEAFDLVRPQDGKLIGRIVEAGADGVEAAVRVASASFRQHRQSAIHERIGWLKDGAAALLRDAENTAALICEDVGKPIRSCRFEVKRGAGDMPQASHETGKTPKIQCANLKSSPRAKPD